ncbi:MAG: hypothetical protein ABI699_11035 [Caldimonas sp.]
MAEVLAFPDGDYRFIRGVFQYSAGVAAEPGFEIERVRFFRPLALREGFEAIQARLEARGRALTAFCACELRSPAPVSEAGFSAFNEVYVEQLKDWSLYRDDLNPVARSNVCPANSPPAEPSIHAFSYTVPAAAGGRGTFVVAGSAEAPEGRPGYRDHAIAAGDVSPRGIVEKARWTLAEMERRMGALGFCWDDSTALQLYTVHDTWPLLEQEMAERGAIRAGLTWHYARPPVIGLEYELDTRAVQREFVL